MPERFLVAIFEFLGSKCPALALIISIAKLSMSAGFPRPECRRSFSVWYAAQGMGRIHSMPAFAPDKFEATVKAAK
jgi:hypothetical protein